nr:MAG TPA: hypothetical protein [Caudoviricetes sp.]
MEDRCFHRRGKLTLYCFLFSTDCALTGESNEDKYFSHGVKYAS